MGPSAESVAMVRTEVCPTEQLQCPMAHPMPLQLLCPTAPPMPQQLQCPTQLRFPPWPQLQCPTVPTEATVPTVQHHSALELQLWAHPCSERGRRENTLLK